MLKPAEMMGPEVMPPRPILKAETWTLRLICMGVCARLIGSIPTSSPASRVIGGIVRTGKTLLTRKALFASC